MGENQPDSKYKVVVKTAKNAEKKESRHKETRWYHYEGYYITFKEFRHTPVGRDILRGDEETREEELKVKWRQLLREDEHKNGGDPWALQAMMDNGLPWQFSSTTEKLERVFGAIIKFCAVWGVFYLFIVSLGLMGDAFKILGGRPSGRAFRDNELMAMPVAALAIGILATVLMQSSSTTTSIVISMTSSGLVTTESAAYLVMGANIGTSVTNTIVAMAHLNSPEECRRAFAGAVFHDVFNWLTVLIFFPLEVTSGFLMRLSKAAVDSLELSDNKRNKPEFLKMLTAPATGRIISVDSKLINKIAEATDEQLKKLDGQSIIKQNSGHLFRDSPIPDAGVGMLLLFVALVMLPTCLMLLVKLLNSILSGRVAFWTRYLLNITFKHRFLRICGGLDNYILLLFGLGTTILVQSSSVFTSTVTPLVGIGLVHVEKMVPLTHGANIGTTITGVLSALSGDNVDIGLQVALEHVFFNSLGTFLWFVIWPLRPIPMLIAKFLGETASNLRWFPLTYILVMFIALPGIVLALALAGNAVLISIGTLILVIVFFMLSWVWIRRNRADILPRKGVLKVLRSNAICGLQMPNFMLLWGGDFQQDRVDIDEKRVQEQLEKQEKVEAAAWPQAPVAWGIITFSFLTSLLASTSGQWRRVRYGDEPTSRKEFGFGFEDVCSGTYAKETAFATQPPDCDLDNMLRCAEELTTSCAADSAWATKPHMSSAEKGQYEDVWKRCSLYVGCRAHAWKEHCPELSHCRNRSYHSDFCEYPIRNYEWFKDVDPDGNGVEVDYSFSGVAGQQEFWLPHDSHFPTESNGALRVHTLPAQSFASTVHVQPSLSGVAYDVCTGNVHVTTDRGPTVACPSGTVFSSPTFQPSFATLTLARLLTSTEAAWHVDMQTGWTAIQDGTNLTGLPLGNYEDGDCLSPVTATSAAQGVNPTGWQLVADGVYATVDFYTSAVLLVRQSGSVMAKIMVAGAGGAEAVPVMSVLPADFTASGGNGIGSLGVSPNRTHLHACMRKPLVVGSRFVRCAVVELDVQTLNASLRAVQVFEVSTASSEVGALHWLGGATLAVLERNPVEGNALVWEADFALATDIKSMGVDFESAMEANRGHPGVLLYQVHGITTASQTLRLDSGELNVNGTAFTGLFVPNAHTLVLVEANQWGSAPSRVFVVGSATDMFFEQPTCSKVKNSEAVTNPFRGEDGTQCRRLSDVCPEGDLAHDMRVMRGLVCTAATTFGLSLFSVVLYVFALPHNAQDKAIDPAMVNITLGWAFGLAAWTYMASLNKKHYACLFEDESLRGGMVLMRGRLDGITIASYSWAVMILAWSVSNISLYVVWRRWLKVFFKPGDASPYNGNDAGDPTYTDQQSINEDESSPSCVRPNAWTNQ
ncbi:hypothetical protein DIPPA_23782 [Diplonema papillatum]|nr:hypothetical protein DIPPA_23782 [Diplonema papillatum]